MDVARLYSDFWYFADECLRVQEKDTLRVVKFEPKPVQVRLGNAILERYLSGRPARFIVLKARREGVSTLVQAIFFWLACTRRHQSGMTLSHSDQTTGELFGMTERFYQKMPDAVRPQKNKGQRGKALELANKTSDPVKRAANPGQESILRTVTFENEGAGQAANLLHLSEVGLWGEKGRSVVTTVLQTVPHAPRTIVVAESTARGVGNLFYEWWTQAEKSQALGGTAAEYGFTPFFIPWFEEPSYSLAAEADKLGELDSEELDLRAKFGVSDAQIAWRRFVGIPVQARGEPESFKQEYPAWPLQAFLSTGRPYFDQELVQEYRDSAQPPEWTGELVEEEGWIKPVPSARGSFKVWDMPEPGTDYIVMADCAEGTGDGDYQSVHVLERDRLRVAAVWHGRIPRDDLGDVLFMVGKLYNTALVACELNGGWGETPVAILRRRGYPRIYRRIVDAENTKRSKRTRKYGWMTTPANRVRALDSLDKAIRFGDLECLDADTFDECSTFIIGPDGKPQAAPGRHDDRVMSLAVACLLWHTEAKTHHHPKQSPKRRPLSQITGY